MKKGHHMCIAVNNHPTDERAGVGGTGTLRVRRIDNGTDDDDLDAYDVILYPETCIGDVERTVASGTAEQLPHARVSFFGRHIAQAIAEAFRKR